MTRRVFACKRAFALTCRPLIGLDGCFLKGRYGGHLLAAIGKDGNNQMLPIAFALVEAETKEVWDWILELLLADLNDIQPKKWSFISDQQKGLVNTIASIPDAHEHRFCIKHLYGNFKKRHAWEHLTEAIWITARCTTMVEFNKAMDNLKKIDEAAWKEMSEYAPSTWSRAGFSTYTCCDLQVNNMCEAFNSAIVDISKLPLISLIDGLKLYITNRIVRLRDYMLRYDGKICPMINKLLINCKKEAEGWSPNWSGDSGFARFTVSNGNDSYAVNLGSKSCACKKWDLSGIPCPHAIACI